VIRPQGWVGVELRHFLALEAVAAEASFIRAATRLGYTQSAISQQIAALERAVGQKLVERPGGSRPIRLTRAGEVLVEHAQALGARLSSAQADLRALTEGALGPLRVGKLQSVGAFLLPSILRRFAGLRPDVEVLLAEGHADVELIELLEQGEIDLAFAHLPLPAGGLEYVRLVQDDYVLVVEELSPLACGAPLTLAELAELPLIGFNKCRACHLVIEYLRANGHQPNFVLRSDDVATIQGSVAAGFGAALLPRLAVDTPIDGVKVVELHVELPPRQIALAWSGERTEPGATQAFVLAATAECARWATTRLRAAV
jgi:DNA-binding transcriptional LysR family regulator